jgi:hypothetical protein
MNNLIPFKDSHAQENLGMGISLIKLGMVQKSVDTFLVGDNLDRNFLEQITLK